MSFLVEHLGGGTWRADPPFSSVTSVIRERMLSPEEALMAALEQTA